MGYTPGFANDVFVSYATVDNEVIVVDGEERRGWVDTMLEKLRRELNSRIGGREVSFVIDHEFMKSHQPITSQILDAVRRSATLLVVMSPGYLRSEWCRRERSEFLSVAQNRIAQGSILVVRARPVERDDQPEEFRDLRGIEFFSAETSMHHRMLGSPDPNELDFVDRICTLSEELGLQLQQLRARREPTVTQVPGERVFVATATEDLEDREDELRSYLMQAGFQVIPSPLSRYPTTDHAAYEAAMLAEVSTCTLFAQLLGPTRGRELDFAPGKRLSTLQLGIAVRGHVPVVQWRPRDLDLDTIRSPDHRALLEGAQASGFEEFKRSVVERATPKPVKPIQRPPSVTVFVNANATDRGLAKELGHVLSNIGVDCYWPIEGGPPESIRADLEDNLLNCDGLVLVYGQTRLDWVQQQLRQARKVLSVRERPAKTLALYEGPPAEKPGLAAAIPNLMTLNCRNGVDSHVLRQFVDSLRE